MQYKIHNTTLGSAKPVTIMIESSSQWNNLILKPGDTMAVTEAAMEQLSTIPDYAGYWTNLGPTVDTMAPVALTVTLPGVGTWSLQKLGRFCTNFKFITTSTNCLVSFSGWDSPATAPATQYQIPIVPDSVTNGDAFTLDMVMDSSRSMYVSGTGTLTIVGI